MLVARRSFIMGAAASLLTAPAIVRADSLMPVKVVADYRHIYWRGMISGQVMIQIIGWDQYGRQVSEMVRLGESLAIQSPFTLSKIEVQTLARNAPDVVAI